MTAPRIRAGALLDAAAIRAAAESHPRLRGFMRTVAAHGEGGDLRANHLMEHIIRRVVTDIGEIHVGGSLLRLEKIQILRDNLAAILDNVLEGHELPQGVSVELLGGYFDELSTEMRELSKPREAIVGDQPLDLYHDAADYAETVVREFEGGPVAGGRHVEPQAALQDAFRNLPADQQVALRRATGIDPRAVWRVVSSESEAGAAKRLGELETALAGQLTTKELADLRAGVAELGKARSKGLQVSGPRLAEALARITDPELRAAVVAGADVWIVQQVAIHNPEGLATLWAQFRAKGGAATDASGFRGYLRHEMVTFGKAVPAEYTAAFSLSSVEQFLKGPDANPRLKGTDLVGITADDWVWLIDDKSHRTASVSDVSALTDNLATNLRRDVADFRTAIADLKAADPGFVADPKVLYAIQRMEDVAEAVEYIERHGPASTRPERIRAVLEGRKVGLKVTSAMGEVRDIAGALKELGLSYEPTGRGRGEAVTVGLTKSFVQYANVPSAVISDGIIPIPLWSVSQVSLSETYHLPPIGSTAYKAIVATHDDTVTLAGVLVGEERYAWKVALETMAEASKRGTALAAISGGKLGGLILITSMTIRTDMQVQSLTFSASAARRDVLEVSISLAHLPRPSLLGKLLDVASVAVGALADGLGGVMPPFPISRYLVPDQPPAVPAGFTALRQALTGGLPQRIELGAGLHAVLVLPTGLARQWLDADPLDLVLTSADDLARRPAPEAPDPVPLAGRAPLRLVVRRGTQVLGSVPLSAGLRRACADGGAAGQGTAVEVAVVAWHLCAGTVRGPGDYGSFVSLGWRQADLATDVFGPPPVHQFVLRRLPPDSRVESDLGQEPDADELHELTLSKRLRRLAR